MIKKVHLVLLSLIILCGCSGKMSTLGINNGQLLACPNTPNCVNSQANDKAHFIQAILFSGSLEEAQTRLLEVLNEWKQAKIIVTQDNYIRAEFVSKVFRFIDDVEFYFPATLDKEITIHIRSASRVGHSDLGVNRKRIETIRSLVQQKQ